MVNQGSWSSFPPRCVRTHNSTKTQTIAITDPRNSVTKLPRTVIPITPDYCRYSSLIFRVDNVIKITITFTLYCNRCPLIGINEQPDFPNKKFRGKKKREKLFLFFLFSIQSNEVPYLFILIDEIRALLAYMFHI